MLNNKQTFCKQVDCCNTLIKLLDCWET